MVVLVANSNGLCHIYNVLPKLETFQAEKESTKYYIKFENKLKNCLV